MTYKTGRLGRRYSRAGMMDPRGQWGTGVPASAGFMPQQQPVLQGDGYVFASVAEPEEVVYPCGQNEDGTLIYCRDWVRPGQGIGQVAPKQQQRSSQFKPGLKLSRQGAQRTRGAPRRNR